jgi:hypothetical protein
MSYFGMNQTRNQYQGDDHIYYNLSIDNAFNGVNSGTTIECVYDKQTPNVLRKQSDYEVAVDSWQVRASLPIFVCNIREGVTATNRDATPFTVCYEFTTGGVTTRFDTELIWLPDPKFLDPTEGPLPKPPSQNNGIQDLLTNPGYYWSTKFNTMVKMINTAFTTSYNLFNAAHPGIHAAPAYLQYNPQSGLFSMVGLTSYATAANPAKVFVNALLYKYLDTIPARFYGYNRPGGCEYQIDFELRTGESNGWVQGNPDAGVVPNPLTTPPLLVLAEQESDSRRLWNNITQILITSNSISVRDEYLPYRNKPQQITNKDFDQFNQSKRSVISYLDYNATAAAERIDTSVSRDINYSPKYRKYIDLVSNDALNNINIEIFYVIGGVSILPLNLPSTASADISLVFRRKACP